jgi:hypothetical protein
VDGRLRIVLVVSNISFMYLQRCVAWWVDYWDGGLGQVWVARGMPWGRGRGCVLSVGQRIFFSFETGFCVVAWIGPECRILLS